MNELSKLSRRSLIKVVGGGLIALPIARLTGGVAYAEAPHGAAAGMPGTVRFQGMPAPDLSHPEAMARVSVGSKMTLDDADGTMKETLPPIQQFLNRCLALRIDVQDAIFEAFGGFLADSQALKADALDFIGDGSITLIGILALAWSARTRARVALTQGLFLGALGLGVIGLAVWRSLNAVAPEAGLMGGIAAAALVVNIAAALVLMRFREGDAHVSAIWLFSRNDAIANVGVIIAAVLVAWTEQAWPDLLVAAIIALIFLHSAYLIVRRATEELRAQHASALERVVSK